MKKIYSFLLSLLLIKTQVLAFAVIFAYSFFIIMGVANIMMNGLIMPLIILGVIIIFGIPLMGALEVMRSKRGKPSTLSAISLHSKKLRLFVRCWAIFLGILTAWMSYCGIVAEIGISKKLLIILIWFIVGYCIVWYSFILNVFLHNLESKLQSS